MPDVSEARVHVVNRGLVKVGNGPSYTVDSEAELGGIVDLVWPGVAAKVIALYDWSHCRKTYPLTSLAEAPGNGWTYGFALPGERIGEPVAILDQAGVREHYLREFMIEAGNVYTNVTPCWARCRVMLDPSYWDEGFREGFAIALAAGFAVPLLQDLDLEAAKNEEAFGRPAEQGNGGYFGKLIALNKSAQPQGRNFMADDPLTNARFR